MTQRAPVATIPEAPVPDHHLDTPFATCPACGVLVQVRRWDAQEGWRELPVPESAALGLPHRVAQGTCVPRTEEAP